MAQEDSRSVALPYRPQLSTGYGYLPFFHAQPVRFLVDVDAGTHRSLVFSTTHNDLFLSPWWESGEGIAEAVVLVKGSVTSPVFRSTPCFVQRSLRISLFTDRQP